MGTVVKIKISNRSGIAQVRFVGVQFDGSAFVADINDGDTQSISSVQNGDVSLTAFRVSDQNALDTMTYPVSDSMGFAAVLMPSHEGEIQPYMLVGEPFVISDS